MIISNIQRYLVKFLGWIIHLRISHTIAISKYNPLANSSYIKLSKELDHPKKGLITIQNINNNDYFKWCFVSADQHPSTITRVDKYLARELDFKDIKFLVKSRDTHKIGKKNQSGNSVFGYENKKKYSVHVSKRVLPR